MVIPERSKEAMAMLALHEALRNVCINFDWTYSVFWTIRPRPRCRGGTNCKLGEDNGSLMLMWEDGFCHMDRVHASSRPHLEDLVNEQVANQLPLDGEDPIWKAFRKMSIQLYNYGEGLMGKVASDKCHKWVFKESPECEVGISSYWQSSFDAHPPEWLDQFAAGIQTIAVIQAGQGLLQLGSCKVVAEDLHFVLRMRHAFESLDYPSGLFLPQPFSRLRSVPSNVYTPGFPPPPSPHSWSLSTNLASIDASRLRAGLFKPTIDTTPNMQGFDRKDDMKNNIIANNNTHSNVQQSPRLSLNTMSPIIQDSLNKQAQIIPSPQKLQGKEFRTHLLTHQKRDTLTVSMQPNMGTINGGDHAHVEQQNLLIRPSQVSSPSSSKLYQRRFSLMQPKFHQNSSPFLSPINPPPTSISSLEALLAQRSPFHATTTSPQVARRTT